MEITASVSFLPSCIPVCLAAPSLPPSACQREQALSFWEAHPRSFYHPCSFWGTVLCGMVWFTLQTARIVVCEHTGPDCLLIQHQGETANQNPLVQDLLCWPWEVELGCHKNSMSHLMSVKNCQSPLCRNWIQQKYQQGIPKITSKVPF